ncbi:MAG: methyltransferase [bacterium]|nr:methyltransferase [bacterium]
MIKKIVLRDQKRYFWKEGEIQSAVKGKKKLYWTSGDLHTPDGILKEKDIETTKGKVLSHSGKEFFTLDANFVDQIKKINRGPQTLVLKDLGYILIHSGVGKDSLVVDAGTGCGLLAALMGRYAKKVISYDINKENIALAQKNLKFLQIENVEVKEGNVYEKIEEKDIDILTLDLAEPWRVNLDCVKNGGTIIIYLPSITQVMEFCNTTKEHVEKVIELLEREWHVEGKKVRPKSDMLGHTAFLIILRKL